MSRSAPAPKLVAARPMLMAFLPGNAMGADFNTPCSLPKATAEPAYCLVSAVRATTPVSACHAATLNMTCLHPGNAGTCKAVAWFCAITAIAMRSRASTRAISSISGKRSMQQEDFAGAPVRVMAPMRVPKKMELVCTPSPRAGCARKEATLVVTAASPTSEWKAATCAKNTQSLDSLFERNSFVAAST